MMIRLIVPNTVSENHTVLVYGPEIASLAGGFTATQASGGWLSGKHFLVVESVTVFDCYAIPDGNICVKFYSLAQRIARELAQDCIYLSIDGNVEFVKPENPSIPAIVREAR